MQIVPPEPLGEHAILVLFIQLFALLLVARFLGELAKKANLPSLVGELLAGIVLGPSLFGALAPGLFTTVFPQTGAQYHLLDAVSWIGLAMLLIVTGLEVDPGLIKRKAKTATYISATGIIIPFVFGFGLGWILPSEFLAESGQRLAFALFLAVAMSITAIPVISKILIDLDMIKRDLAQLTIAAGMIDDTAGWVLLSIVAAIASASAGAALSVAAESIVYVAIFLGLAFTIGPRLVEWVFRFIDTTFDGDELAKLSALFVLAAGGGAITHFMGVELVLGTFIVGLLVGQNKRFGQSAQHMFEALTISIFAPIFFAVVGLRVDMTTLLDPTVFVVMLACMGIAIIGKFAGASTGAWMAGLSRWEGLVLGSGMNARGAVELIVAVIGLSIGVLTIEMYSIIVLIALATSLIAPSLLLWTFPKAGMSDEEAARLERRSFERRSFVGNIVRVLLPTRCSVDSQLAAQLVGHIARSRDQMEVTSMYVNTERTKSSGGSLGRRLKRAISVSTAQQRTQSDGGIAESRMNVADESGACLDLMDAQIGVERPNVRDITRNVASTISETVLNEAQNGYDLLAFGASKDARENGGLFSIEIDNLIRDTPCPLLVVISNMNPEETPLDDVPIHRIIFPTVGTEYSRHAAEIAFAIATDAGAITEITHVVRRPRVETYTELDLSEAVGLGEEIVDREAELGRTMGAEVLTNVLVGDTPEQDIVERAAENDIDLIVLGSELRPVSRRAFFGHRVEYIIENAPCPVVVISSV